VVHFVSAAGEPLALLNPTLAGLWLGLLAERSGGLALAGSALWGGGGEALNASLATTFVLAGAVVAAALWPGHWPLRAKS